jgi:hypothetical protein
VADLSGGPGYRHDGVMHWLLSWITAAGRALRALLQRLGLIRASVGGWDVGGERAETVPGRCRDDPVDRDPAHRADPAPGQLRACGRQHGWTGSPPTDQP